MAKHEKNDMNVAYTSDVSAFDTPFSREYAQSSLRVTVYGSSSGKTPQRYLTEARRVGFILAKRGHICVNGAGQFGCMAAMNEGVELGNGSVVGVIHEMFLVDNGYWETSDQETTTGTSAAGSGTGTTATTTKSEPTKRTVIMRDGGAHDVFTNATTRRKDEKLSTITPCQQPPIREILVAGGNDLQERKKLLVRGTDALIVLPGGPGTWDELWEMACARHLNLNQLPIVCVNVGGFYEPFRQMLEQAWDDELIKMPPEDIVHFAPNAEEAVRWVELETERLKNGDSSKKTRRDRRSFGRNNKSLLQRTSFFSASPYQNLGRRSFFSWTSATSEADTDDDRSERQGMGDIDRSSDLICMTGLSFSITLLASAAMGGLAVFTCLRNKN
jgi:predicted Rossmann-fold nucleotide-binding protein